MRRRSGGYTLIELMIVTACMGLSTVAFMTVMSDRHRGAAELEQRADALRLAEDVLEELRAATFAEREQVAAAWRARQPERPPGARVGVALEPLAAGLDRIVVTVEWTSARGRAQSVRLATARGDHR